MKSIINNINEYYSNKIKKYGPSPQGVDWNSAESQNVRFSQLSKIIAEKKNVTISDLGCGYGALYDYLAEYLESFNYIGIDVSYEMINEALSRVNENNANFCVGDEPFEADYGIASGIFNVMLEKRDSQWLEYIKETLFALNKHSSKGFSFNCLTSYSDEEKKKEYLYYADPLAIFDFCKMNFSKNVALLHDYDLYEFTILVRK